ncbi:ATP-dependent DNA helicase RecQ [uncultured Polaribacter sp.]|uniref:RecQ family ATP-dependent DNA helicase n=1 Tax=uncultured Polaribacter sp. TaxID=174711 RepID=UPI00261FD042|nr:ATP-dependent DNA helicase RecQ [uncultured Polaribacter sp.]
MTNSPKQILSHFWGFKDFIFPQETVINAVLEKQDVIALLPTGAGKSICFQIPALAFDGICLVISPLIALMQDQVENLSKKNIKASCIPNGASQDEIITLFDNLKFGGYKFLYLSPERLQSRFIQEKIKELTVNLIAIDEAHCISEWGHDFRPSYRNIKILKDIHPTINYIALTATANKKVIEDIVTNLSLTTPNIFKKSFFKENLAYQLFKVEDKLGRLIQIFTKTRNPAIVYVNSRKKTIEISNFLNNNGFKSGFYHGGLTGTEKQMAYDNWITESTPIIVATNAFGMGIDKDNIKLVIHYNLPSSIENYVQECGRAGRNNKKAFAALLYNNEDLSLLKNQLESTSPSIREIKEILKNLYQHFRIPFGELPLESYDFNFLAFCKKYNLSTFKVDTTLKILNNNGVLEINQNYNQKSTLQFSVSSKQVLRYSAYNNNIANFISTVLRTYGGLFEKETTINEYAIAKKVGTTSNQVIAQLKKLHDDQLLVYKGTTSNASLTFLTPREDDKTVNRCSKEIKKFIEQKRKKTNEFIHFVENDTICRSIQILNYFDENSTKQCGLCDVCLKEKKKNTNKLSENILQIIMQRGSLSSSEIRTLLHANEKDILIHLRYLLAEQKISINNQNKYQLN